MSGAEIAMVTGDLLFASRVQSALGAAAVTVVDGAELPTATTVFVDLNARLESRLELIARLRARGDTRIVGFCQHDQRSERIRAIEAGADQVVTNGSLPAAALRVVAAARGDDA